MLVIKHSKIHILSFGGSSQIDFMRGVRSDCFWNWVGLFSLRKVKERHTHTHTHSAKLVVTSPNFVEAFRQAFILPLSDKTFLLNFSFGLSPSSPLLHLYNDKNSVMESFKGGFFLPF